MKLYSRLFFYFSVIFCLLMSSIMLFLYNRERVSKSEQLDKQLEVYNVLIYNFIAKDQVSVHRIEDFFSCLPDKYLRVTVIDTLGNVCFDSSVTDDSILENHLQRPEILALKSQKIAKSVRYSQSLGKEYYYVAQRFPGFYVRSSLPYDVSLMSSLKANNAFIYVMACLLFVVMVVLYTISKRFAIRLKESEDKLKRELTQSISHELKTPVSSILGYMESLLNNPDLDVERRMFFVDRTYHQAQRLSSLLQDISVLNKLDESKHLYDRQECNLSEIVLEVLNDFREEIAVKGFFIVNQLPDSMLLKGNKTLIYSIFHNLIDNSLKYAGEGCTIYLQALNLVGSYYKLSVLDNGVGIPKEHINRIFERFYRVDKGRSRKLGGTGLGLSIVKNAVIFHHGEITVKSDSEGGTQFVFSLRKY